MLEEEYAKGAFPGLIHCFSSGPEVARRALALGMYISISGIVTFKAAESLRDHRARHPARPAAGRDRLRPTSRRSRSAARPTSRPSSPIPPPRSPSSRASSMAELEAATTENFFRLFAKAERLQVRVTILGCGTSGGVPRLGGKDGMGEWGAANPADAAQPPHALLDPGRGPGQDRPGRHLARRPRPASRRRGRDGSTR